MIALQKLQEEKEKQTSSSDKKKGDDDETENKDSSNSTPTTAVPAESRRNMADGEEGDGNKEKSGNEREDSSGILV